MSDSESDVEMRSALPKKPLKKLPRTFTQELLVERKITTKEMITEALEDLNTRKGVSLYAIKKYMTEKYNANTDKIGYYIKKYIKSGVENGTIIQTKGIGVSGSFKLAPVKSKIQKKRVVKETLPEKSKITAKPKLKKSKSTESGKENEDGETTNKERENKKKKMEKKISKPKPEKPVAVKEKKVLKKEKNTKKDDAKRSLAKKDEPKKPVTKKLKKEPKMVPEKVLEGTKKANMAKDHKKRAEKRKSVSRRKSLGSIIKPPKMKPARA